MSSEVYRSGGRGGAGNFVSQKQISEHIKHEKGNDLEAQKHAADRINAGHHVDGAYVRAGRGGAGNYYDSATKEEQDAADLENAERAKTAAVRGIHKYGMVGRGGAGNWADQASKDAVEEDEDRRREAIEAKAAKDVDASLQAPSPVHNG